MHIAEKRLKYEHYITKALVDGISILILNHNTKTFWNFDVAVIIEDAFVDEKRQKTPF